MHRQGALETDEPEEPLDEGGERGEPQPGPDRAVRLEEDVDGAGVGEADPGEVHHDGAGDGGGGVGEGGAQGGDVLQVEIAAELDDDASAFGALPDLERTVSGTGGRLG